MKTIMKTGIVALAIAASITSYAVESSTPPSIEQQLVAIANDIASGKIEYFGGRTLKFDHPDLFTNKVRFAALAKTVDDILVNSTNVFNTFGEGQYYILPKTGAKYLKSIENDYPIAVKVLLGEIAAPVKTDKNYIKYLVERELFESHQYYI